MAGKKDLLIEIGTEELPPKALTRLAEAFATGIHDALEKHGLSHSTCHWYATPRRLAVIIDKLVVCQADHEVLKRGPALTAAFDAAGKPTAAAQGFARSCGVDIDALEKLETDKGSWLVYKTLEPGKSTAALLPEIIHHSLNILPIPKRMRWGNHDVEFVRPVHWSVVLFGNEVVPCDILGTVAGNITYGHRFHHPKPVRLRTPKDYLSRLQDRGRVIADFAGRRQLIEKIAVAAANAVGGKALIDGDLLDEVTSLVEWPVAITGSFEEKFLQLPREVLIATMQDHQKYFPVTALDGGKLLNRFITIANIDSKSADEIRQGNERVIRPRLTDAAFFWDRDRRQPLYYYRDKLSEVVFQKQLGTYADKTDRVTRLAVFIAHQLRHDPQPVERAASLARCDLLTEMVGEFPELQGVMGRYYALESGETDEVARALDEQYWPRYAGDVLPETVSGRILSIADKLDTVVGIFAIGQAPSGDKDPFALRRTALGSVRIMIEAELDLDLRDCLQSAAGNFDPAIAAGAITDEVFDFIMERLRRYFLDTGTSTDVFDAVLALKPGAPYDFQRRIHAVSEFRKLPGATDLAAANKRILNILRQAVTKTDTDISRGLLVEPEERDLVEALTQISEKVSPWLQAGDYTRTLITLAGLRDNIDAFFDKVMVMSDDPALRENRLAILTRISTLFLAVADISRLQG